MESYSKMEGSGATETGADAGVCSSENPALVDNPEYLARCIARRYHGADLPVTNQDIFAAIGIAVEKHGKDKLTGRNHVDRCQANGGRFYISRFDRGPFSCMFKGTYCDLPDLLQIFKVPQYDRSISYGGSGSRGWKSFSVTCYSKNLLQEIALCLGYDRDYFVGRSE